jgi:hypothetical protein
MNNKIYAFHGTSIENAESIIKNGYYRTKKNFNNEYSPDCYAFIYDPVLENLHICKDDAVHLQKVIKYSLAQGYIASLTNDTRPFYHNPLLF